MQGHLFSYIIYTCPYSVNNYQNKDKSILYIPIQYYSIYNMAAKALIAMPANMVHLE